jgi:transposase
MELSKLLSGQSYEDVVFLADCALISTGSLLKLAKQNVQFISRLPETFNLAAELKEAAWNVNEWENLGQLAVLSKENAAVYRAWKTFREIEGEKFGFAVIHSSNLEARKGKTLAKEIERQRKALCQKGGELKKQPFACEADARRSAERLRKYSEKKGFDCEVSVSKKEEEAYGHKGRPKRGEVPEIRISWYTEVKNFGMREAIVEEKKRMSSTFVLIYRLAEDKSAEDILRSYKNQDKVEQGFKFLKQPLNLGPVYTKKPERVKALGYIFLMVLLLAKYLEYRVRVSLAHSGEVLKVGGQKVERPTAKTILEHLAQMSILVVAGHLMLPDSIPADVLKIILWSGFDEQVYICGYSQDLFTKMPRPK